MILVAVGMAWGLSSVADRNKAVSIENPSASSERVVMNEQSTSEGKLKLEIINPKEGEVVNKSALILSGKTESMVEVQVDDKELEANEDGEFETKLTLDEGENEIMVTVNNENGEFAEKSVKVTYEPTE